MFARLPRALGAKHAATICVAISAHRLRLPALIDRSLRAALKMADPGFTRDNQIGGDTDK
jgi:hypothetical protein